MATVGVKGLRAGSLTVCLPAIHIHVYQAKQFLIEVLHKSAIFNI